jgi:hypothetical protein
VIAAVQFVEITVLRWPEPLKGDAADAAQFRNELVRCVRFLLFGYLYLAGIDIHPLWGYASPTFAASALSICGRAHGSVAGHLLKQTHTKNWGEREMSFDAQKLLERLSETDRDSEEDVDVTFTFSHQDFEYLIPLAEEIGDLFAENLHVEYDSVVIGYDEHPNGEDKGLPQFTLTYLGPLTADQFAMLHELAAKLAKQHDIAYQGVNWWCE